MAYLSYSAGWCALHCIVFTDECIFLRPDRWITRITYRSLQLLVVLSLQQVLFMLLLVYLFLWCMKCNYHHENPEICVNGLVMVL